MTHRGEGSSSGLDGAIKGISSRLAHMAGEGAYKRSDKVRLGLKLIRKAVGSKELTAYLVSAAGGALDIPNFVKEKLMGWGVPHTAINMASDAIDDFSEGLANKFAESGSITEADVDGIYKSLDQTENKPPRPKDFSEILGSREMSAKREDFLKKLAELEKLIHEQADPKKLKPAKTAMEEFDAVYRGQIHEAWILLYLEGKETKDWISTLKLIFGKDKDSLAEASAFKFISDAVQTLLTPKKKTAEEPKKPETGSEVAKKKPLTHEERMEKIRQRNDKLRGYREPPPK